MDIDPYIINTLIQNEIYLIASNVKVKVISIFLCFSHL